MILAVFPVVLECIIFDVELILLFNFVIDLNTKQELKTTNLIKTVIQNRIHFFEIFDLKSILVMILVYSDLFCDLICL